MNIAFLRPCWPHSVGKNDLIYNRIWPPLCLANCAAILERDGHTVTIVDAHALRLSPLDVAPLLNGFDRVFMTSSEIDRWECPNLDLVPFIETAQSICKNVKELYVMGYHGTVKPEEILRLTQARAVIRGEPEMTVKEICQTDQLSSIEGVSYFDGSKVISTPDRAPFDLGLLPVPAFHLLPIDKYFYELLGDKFVLLEASRGCPHNCLFCLKLLYGHGVRQKKAQQVVAELKVAVEDCGARSGYFIDLDFGMDQGLILSICEFLEEKKYDFKWTCQMRVDTVNKPLLKKMATAGCQLIHFGVETGSQSKLEEFNKQISVEQIKEAIKTAHGLGIETACSFVFDYRREADEGEAKKVVAFAKKLNPTLASFHIIYPYLGTKIYQQASTDIQLRFANFLSQDWFNAKQKNLVRRAFFQFYMRPSYFLSRIKMKNRGNFFNQLKLFLKMITL